MDAIPFAKYTKRNGAFNLVNRLPECFIKPDLGPKMYSAYGLATCPIVGTTNLHLDISDAINVMIYAGTPEDAIDSDIDNYIETAIEKSDCDLFKKKHLKENNKRAGAIWHIYKPNDADEIRRFLHIIARERNIKNCDDPIHDQDWYLDTDLRARLKNEYNVIGQTIIQFHGDAVLIPAGAPHQVQNLLDCIKVALDFVSPENVFDCYKLTDEFRSLTNKHSNKKDKLQLKSIIYHSMLDAFSYLQSD